jgi:hypothetical protein
MMETESDHVLVQSWHSITNACCTLRTLWHHIVPCGGPDDGTELHTREVQISLDAG